MKRIPSRRRASLAATLLAGVTAVASLAGCAPLLLGGAFVGGTMMATDRRTPGTQIEDQGIELKAMNRIRDVIGERGHVSATSYNRVVLITGEAQSEADKAAVEKTVSQIENVRSVVNELALMGASSLTSRSNDLILAGTVKATFVDAKDLHANAFKVVAERGTIYLLGRVTEREARRATELARSVSGVQKVVRVFELVSEAELAGAQPRAPRKP